MDTGLNEMPSRNISSRASIGGGNRDSNHKKVPIHVMVPEAIRRQVALTGAGRGENIRTVVLRGLRAMGIDIPDSEFVDRRGRRRNGSGGGNDAQ